MKKLFNKAWKYLSGKKTIIGASVMLLAKGGKAFFPDLMPVEQYDFIETVGEAITTIGVAHAAVKTKVVNDAIKRAQQSIKIKW